MMNVICYDRHKPDFPRDDSGFACDLGVCLRECGLIEEASLRPLRESVKPLLKDNCTLVEIANSLREDLCVIGNLLNEPAPPLAYFIFFKFQRELRKETDLALNEILPVSHVLRQAGYETEAAVALAMCGAFFGFETFAAVYYERFRERFQFLGKASSELNDQREQKTAGRSV